MAIAVVDFPDPDSPISVTVSPRSIENETPSTARTIAAVGHQFDLQVTHFED